MADEPVYISKDGLEELQKELLYLTTTRRAEIAEAIRQAKEFGDLSENSEYENAKEQQAFVEGRIATLQHMIANAVIIGNKKTKTVQIGSTATVKMNGGDKAKYTIVGKAEADPLEGKISNESPIGQALLGKKVGDKFEAPTPGGVMELEIISL